MDVYMKFLIGGVVLWVLGYLMASTTKRKLLGLFLAMLGEGILSITIVSGNGHILYWSIILMIGVTIWFMALAHMWLEFRSMRSGELGRIDTLPKLLVVDVPGWIILSVAGTHLTFLAIIGALSPRITG